MNLINQFVAAFNAGDLDALAALLAADATAEVIGAPFPQEQGREKIRATSLPHLLDAELSLTAIAADVEGSPGLILVQGAAGAVDTAVLCTAAPDGSALTRLEYLVVPHQPDRVAAVAAALGRPVATEAP
jgi:ketosteroid isomerase-like protein